MFKKTLLLLLICLLCSVALGEFQQITFNNVTNDNTLVTILRERLGRTGDTFTFPNGLTIDNATNNAMEWNENDEALIWTFGTNSVTLSSDTSLVLIDFGTVLPSFDLVTLKNGLTIDNDTNNTLEFNENSDELIMTFGNNIVTFSSGDVLTIGFGSLYQTFDEISAPSGDPTSNKGWLYVKDNGGVSDLYFEGDDGNAIELTASASGVANLDEAYDAGGSGVGRTITADSGAVVINNTDQDAAFLLSVTPTPSGSAATGGIQVASGASSTEDSIQVVNSGSGYSISTDSDAFTVDSSGGVIATTLDVAGGNITLQNDMILDQSANNSWKWTENAEDIVWTFSNDTITASSTTGVVSIDWGSLAPTFGSAIVASSGITANDDITLADGKALKSSTTAAQTAKIQVYDNDTGPGYKDAITLTNGNTPAMSLGSNAMTVAIDSTDWDISTSGAMTGIGAITADGLITGSAGATVNGAALNLQVSSNFAVNVGTGTTTGAVTVGGTGTQTISVGTGAGVKTVALGSSNSSSVTTILSGTGNLTINNNAGAATTGIGLGTTTGLTTIGSGTGPVALAGDIQGATPLRLDGASDNTFEAIIAVTDPTVDVTWTLPDSPLGAQTVAFMSTTLATNIPDAANSVWGGTSQLIFEGSDVDTEEHVIAATDPTADIVWTLPDAGAMTVSFMASTLATNMPDVANSVTGGTSQLVFEGSAANTEEHIIQATNPTADIIWILADGPADSLAIIGSTLITNNTEIANSIWGGTNQLIFEGSDADTEETVITVTDATADNTFTFGDDSGSVVYTPTGKTTKDASDAGIPITHSIVEATSGAASAWSIANGENGQILTIVIVTDGGEATITPATSTGWDTAVLTDDIDTLSVQYIDDTVGWIVLGTAAANGNAVALTQ